MINSKTTVSNPSYRQRTGYHGMLVGGVALMASTLLVMGDQLTSEAIAQRHAEDVQAMLSEVIPPALHDNDLLQDQLNIDDKNVYQARIDNHVSAVAYQVVEPGYSGDITLIIGIDNKGKLLGVRVVSHTETPGLGDKMETARSNWIYSFDGMTLEETNEHNWAVKKDGGQFDQFTGATITPRAIVKAVKHGMLFFQQNREQLLQVKGEEAVLPVASADTSQSNNEVK